MNIDGLSGNISELVDLLRSEREAPVSLTDIASVTEVLIACMERYFATVNSSMYREIQDLADHIAKAKGDISRAQPNEIKSERIPRAGKELGAIVQSTEGATNAIMEAAEEIMASGSANGGGDREAQIEGACMRIFEACSFQDVTGQRISKVVDTLTFIDERLDTLLEAYGGVADSAPVTEEVEDPLLNGPQLEGEGISQDDVDSMFGESESAASADIPPPQPPAGNLSDGAESKNTQAEIDSLFD
jgi:chemotaxis protein CheZ